MSSRTPEARRAARTAARAAAGPAPTPAERTRVTLARELPRASPADLDAVADVVAERAAAEGFDLAAAVADLAAIWCGETPEARADRHAAEDRDRADRWWLAYPRRGLRVDLDAPVYRARKFSSSNAAALRPRVEAPSAIAG